jgi:NADH-quinone oxidoreductase subunit J
MNLTFYVSAVVAVLGTLLVITRQNPVHALLYLIVSLLAVAVILFTLGAPFIAALEVIIYAGAILVLFLFVVMMLNVSPQQVRQHGDWLAPSAWVGPATLALVLLVELVFALLGDGGLLAGGSSQSPQAVGAALYGPYLIGVELASLLLLASLVAAYHLGKRLTQAENEEGGD